MKLTAEQEIEQRPWVTFQTLVHGKGYKVKKIVVNPGQVLSLQMHRHRSEHWVIAKGTATVIVGEERRTLGENESVYIPKSTKHRVGNPWDIPLEMIEVQCGEYLGEDDIVRFDDIYGRC